MNRYSELEEIFPERDFDSVDWLKDHGFEQDGTPFKKKIDLGSIDGREIILDVDAILIKTAYSQGWEQNNDSTYSEKWREMEKYWQVRLKVDIPTQTYMELGGFWNSVESKIYQDVRDCLMEIVPEIKKMKSHLEKHLLKKTDVINQ